MTTVQQTLRSDVGAPVPAPYLETAPRLFGTEPISIDRYISADYQRLEYERLWSRVWQWVCNLEDIPNVGDHLVYDIGDRSVIIVRSAPDRVRAFHNACLHRGRQLKTEAGNSARFVCGFHGWTWNLDGSLDRIPCRWDFPQVVDGEMSLPEVRVETWSQFVFINFDDHATPLLEALDIIPEHFAHFPLDDKYTAAWVQKVVPANWKVTMEAFLESYHTMATHAQLLEWIGDANTQYDIWERSSRLFTMFGVASPFLGDLPPDQIYGAAVEFLNDFLPEPIPSELPAGCDARTAFAELTKSMMGQASGLDLSGVSTSEAIDAVQYWVFPNWCPWNGVANALQYRFRPNGADPHTSIFDIRLMYPVPSGGERPPAAPVHVLAPDEPWSNAPELGTFCAVMAQDESNLRANQKGLRATTRTGLNFSEYQESRIRHFHRLLDEYLDS
jgi:phenylpropionate dioxygenase-like ring-hydroxylating dioxygenase large terminal subunit